jgi:hypothetical protein
MSIEKVNSALPISTKITNLSDQILEVEGLATRGSFDQFEIDAIYSGTGLSRKYKRGYSLGHSRTGSSAWWNWSHVADGTGYGVWKMNVYNFKDNAINLLTYDDKIVDYMGEATSENSTSFDSVFLYDGSTYTDKTAQAATKTADNFSALANISSYIYIGDDAVFSGIAFEFQTFGINYTLKAEYYNGTEWKRLNSNDNELDDATDDFIMNGLLIFTNVGNWATTTINGTTRYWVRISTTTAPETTTSIYSILPSRSVVELLSLSSDQVLNEEFKWCYYESQGVPGTGSAYVTVRNSGATAYEGDYYITSSSSDANKENFFYANHEYEIDYEDKQYDESSQALFLYDYADHDGQIQVGKVVSISGGGLRPASALATHTYGFGISRTTPSSGANCKVQHFGLAPKVLTEKSGSGILCGDRVWLSTGSGLITRTAPNASGQIKQIIGTAKSNETSATTSFGTVDVALFINTDYTVI